MKLERFTTQSCCGGLSVIFKIGKPITKEILNTFINLGFVESAHFTKAGILYATNADFILTGPFGSDKLQVKCKKSDCDQKLNDFESLLLNLE